MMESRLMLRPYQAEAVEAITEGLADGGTGQLEAACGTGKTLIALHASHALVPDDGCTVLLAPSLALVAQTLTEWRTHTHRRWGQVLAVCGDDTIADAPVHLADLQGAHVTTDPAQIAEHLNAPRTAPTLVVGTYASASRLAQALRGRQEPADLLVLDEAHHLAGQPDATTRRLTDPVFLPARRRLYMTATRRIDAAAASRSGLLSMDDKAVFGPVLYSYPFGRAIAEAYLSDYRLYVVGVPDREARGLLAASGHLVDAVGGPDLQTMAAHAALVRAREELGIRRAITFHPRVESAAEFARTLAATAARMRAGEDGPLYAGHVHGGMDHAQRSRILDRLRRPADSGWSVVANARCLGEGVDLPAVDAVMFAHPKRSAVDIIQAVGRALRLSPDSTGPATVIIPLVVPDEGGEIGDVEPGEYEVLWRVVRALRANDEPLGIALDRRRGQYGGLGETLPPKLTVVMRPGASQKVLDQVRLLIVRQATSRWWDGLAAAGRYREQHGHLLVPHGYVAPDGYPLGRWLTEQRTEYRRGWLAVDRVDALEHFGIAWDPLDHRWQAFLVHARAYHAQYGHLRARVSYVTADGYPLGKQLAVRRSQRNTGVLSAAWAADLDELGMVWGEVRARFWEAYDRLREYHAEHGHLDIPPAYKDPDGYALGRRVYKLRAQGRDALREQEAGTLEGLGWRWDGQEYRTALVNAAVQYRAQHGDLDIPAEWIDPDSKARLAGWLAHVANGGIALSPWEQRALGHLPKQRSGQPAWGMAFPLLQEYHAEHGDLNIPARYQTPDGYRLGAALAALRYYQRQGKLHPQRVQALEDLGVVWSVRSERFEEFLQACDRFIDLHGHLRVPVGYVDEEGFPLGAKIVYYRQLAKGNAKGNLSAERREQLEARGMVWDTRTGIEHV